jgi:hypothetical protein
VCSALIVSQLLVFAFLEKKIRISKVESEMWISYPGWGAPPYRDIKHFEK